MTNRSSALVGLLLANTLAGCASSRPPAAAPTPPLGQAAAAAPKGSLVLDDSLQGTTKGVLVGGSLSAEGYRPGKGCNHVLYELPPTQSGSIEFEVKGMQNLTGDVEHGFFAMYDGRGLEEPIDYMPQFRENFFRWNVHWRGEREALKAVLNLAAATPERQSATQAVFPTHEGKMGRGRDWVKEPTGKKVAWDPNKWHRFRIEWRDRVHSVWVDDELNWQVKGDHDFAPVAPRVWLGSAPCRDKTGGKYASHLDDIVYRNFRVTTP